MDSGYYCLTDGVCRGRPGLDDSWGVDMSGCATGIRRASMWATEVSTFMECIEIIMSDKYCEAQLIVCMLIVADYVVLLTVTDCLGFYSKCYFLLVTVVK